MAVRINKIGLAAPQVIVNAHIVISVGRCLKSNITIGPSGIIIANDMFFGAVENVDDRIKAGSNPSSETLDMPDLTLFCRELEIVEVVWLTDDAVDCMR